MAPFFRHNTKTRHASQIGVCWMPTRCFGLNIILYANNYSGTEYYAPNPAYLWLLDLDAEHARASGVGWQGCMHASM